MSTKHITILGAGLAGSLVAIYLARRGYEVDVYERRSDMRKVDMPAGRSINLALANRGIRALVEVGLQRHVNELLTTMRGRMLHEVGGQYAHETCQYDQRRLKAFNAFQQGPVEGSPVRVQ